MIEKVIENVTNSDVDRTLVGVGCDRMKYWA